MEKIDQILSFWFQSADDGKTIVMKEEPFRLWFKKDAAFDLLIKEKFEEDILKAKNKAYDNWRESPRGTLALLILFDQFTRNIYRNNAKMFECDEAALTIAKECIEKKFDLELKLIERGFVYMPLMHAEDLECQDLCIQCFTQLVKDSDDLSPQNSFYYQYNLDYAVKHKVIIEQYGRFAHRNNILGRESTSEEIEFLKQPGSSF